MFEFLSVFVCLSVCLSVSENMIVCIYLRELSTGVSVLSSYNCARARARVYVCVCVCVCVRACERARARAYFICFTRTRSVFSPCVVDRPYKSSFIIIISIVIKK